MNIKELYEFGRQTLADPYFKNPALEASVLLYEATGIDKLAFYKDKEKPVTKEQVYKYKELLERRLLNEPIAYIVGRKEFYSREFTVDSSVLIPRPETELLVDKVIDIARAIESPHILDIGTGSGCIAITLQTEIPESVCVGTDISEAALAIARHNAAKNKTSPLFIQGSLTECIGDRKFDIVVSNPPYVKEKDFSKLDRGVKEYEPKTALVSEQEGLAIIKNIIGECTRVLHPGGWCLLEIGYDQSARVVEMFALKGYKEIEIFKDLSGIDRVIKAKWTK